jgi:hypothetical protein
MCSQAAQNKNIYSSAAFNHNFHLKNLEQNAVHEISFSFQMMYMKTSILILCCSGIANLAYRDTSENTILKYTSER